MGKGQSFCHILIVYKYHDTDLREFGGGGSSIRLGQGVNLLPFTEAIELGRRASIPKTAGFHALIIIH